MVYVLNSLESICSHSYGLYMYMYLILHCVYRHIGDEWLVTEEDTECYIADVTEVTNNIIQVHYVCTYATVLRLGTLNCVIDGHSLFKGIGLPYKELFIHVHYMCLHNSAWGDP